MTTLHDITDDPCDDIDDLEQISFKYLRRKAYGRDSRKPSDKKDNKVTTRMTNDPK